MESYKIRLSNFWKFWSYFFIFSIFFLLIESKSYSKSYPSSFADLAEKLMPSVVNISTTQTIQTNPNVLPFQFPPGSPFEELFKDFNTPKERSVTSLGSGFIIDKSGIVVTNFHVIQGAEDIIVRVNGKEEHKAKILGSDPLSDLALLQIEVKKKFIPVKFGDSDKARVGDWVVAIGNPFGLGGTVTSGIISAKHRDINLTRYDDLIQTDASINQGNSGGPLFNLKGEVIGINQAIIAPGSSGSIGIGFAIPSNAANKIIEQLIKFGETKRGWLGVRIQEVTKEIAEIEKLDEPAGALIASIFPKSPAQKAGIKEGDIILEFDGKKVNSVRDLPKLVAETEVGKSVLLKIWRNRKMISKKVKLGRLESSEEFKAEQSTVKPNISSSVEVPDLKIYVRDLTDDDLLNRNLPDNTKGVVVTKIENDSPMMFLSENDVIVELQKKKISSAKQFQKMLKNIVSKGEKTLLFAVYNNNNQRSYLTVTIP